MQVKFLVSQLNFTLNSFERIKSNMKNASGIQQHYTNYNDIQKSY